VPDTGERDVEGVVGERECGRVALLPVDRLDASGFGVLACVVEHRRRDVETGHVGTTPCRGDRDVARATGDVEDAVVRLHVGRLDQMCRHREERPPDVGIRPERPDSPYLFFRRQVLEILNYSR
jgi:hypothetical protein